MGLPDANLAINIIESYFRLLSSRRFHRNAMEIIIQINFDGETLFEGKIDHNEKFVSEIMGAILSKKDPIKAICILMDIGSKEIYTTKYVDDLKKYFRRER